MVLGYAVALLYFTWPISEISINKAGVFGDSFGVLTSLFSGLAFSGMIITILLQRQELQLQRLELKESRKEFSKSANAQEKNAQLSALTALLNNNNEQITYLEKTIDKNIDSKNRHRIEDNTRIEAIIQGRQGQNELISSKITEILNDSGIEIK